MRKNLLLIILFNITLAAFAQVPSYVPSNGLVGWWPFNGNANDESGNGNNGTIYGASLSTDRNNYSNAAYNFNGSSNYILIPNNNNLNSNYITISIWFNTSSKSFGSLIYKTNSSAINEQYSCVVNYPTNDNTIWSIKNGNNCNKPGMGWQSTNLNSNISDGNWHQLILTYNGSVSNIFLDQKLVSISSFNSSVIDVCGGDINIGKGYNSVYMFNGKIDDIGIWNRALDSNEVKLLYNGCNKSITIQPENQGMFNGNALFTCASNDTLLTYQWQSNSGMGWNNLSNAGQYNGVNTDSLIINNVSTANNNQLFRCIIKGNCLTDTTEEATLRVWGLGINGVNLPEFKLYPNPSSNAVTIAYSQNPYSIAVYNSIGQMVLSQSALTNEHTFDISQWPKGVYYVELIDAATQTNKVQKLIRN
jgi:hypothetical protein